MAPFSPPDELIRKFARSRGELKRARKFDAWKIALAVSLKAKTTVTYRWLMENLSMGSLHEVSRQVSAWSRQPDRKLMRKIR